MSPTNLDIFFKEIDPDKLKATDVSLVFEFTFFRPGPVGAQRTSIKHSTLLNVQDRSRLSRVLTRVSDVHDWDIGGASPKFVRLSGVASVQPQILGSAHDKWHTFQNLTLTLKEAGGDVHQEWWEITQTADDIPFDGVKGQGITVLVVSDRIAGGAAAALFSGGLLAFYAAVVLTIGKFMKIFLKERTQAIIYEEMPNTEDFLHLCESVYIARSQNNLALEKQLWTRVITLWRSPESLLRLTGTNYDKAPAPTDAGAPEAPGPSAPPAPTPAPASAAPALVQMSTPVTSGQMSTPVEAAPIESMQLDF